MSNSLHGLCTVHFGPVTALLQYCEVRAQLSIQQVPTCFTTALFVQVGTAFCTNSLLYKQPFESYNQIQVNQCWCITDTWCDCFLMQH